MERGATGPDNRTRVDPRTERAHAAVLDSAVALFLEEGVAAVTIDAVTARSGVAKTTIYRRWANRDDLLLDVLRRFAFRLDRPPANLDPETRVRLVARQLAAGLANPVARQALPALLGAMAHKKDLAALAERLEVHQARVVRTTLTEAQAAGALPPETDIGEAVLQLVGPLFTAALMRPDLLSAAFADRLVAVLFGPGSTARREDDGD